MSSEGVAMGADPVALLVEQWARQLPDLDASPLLVIGRIQRLAARCDALLRPPFAAAGLAPGDFDVLAALRRRDPDPVTPGQLSEAMLVTPGAATKRVDRLIAMGLVTRARSGRDGRGRLVSLTRLGRSRTDEMIRMHLAYEARILEALDPDRRRLLGELLGELLAAVEPEPDR